MPGLIKSSAQLAGLENFPDPGLHAFKLLLAATQSAHQHRKTNTRGRSSRPPHAGVFRRGADAELSLTVAGRPTCGQKPSSQHKRRGKRLGANPETVQAGSTAAGTAVESSSSSNSRHGLNGRNAAAQEVVEQRKQETNGIEMMARNHPSQNGSSAAARGLSHDRTNGSTSMPIICAPEEFQLEPGMVSPVSPSLQSPLDVFRCSGCTRTECQVCSETFKDRFVMSRVLSSERFSATPVSQCTRDDPVVKLCLDSSCVQGCRGLGFE